ncbi:cyclin-dependent kinase inhibitor 7-like [Cornus florida]|uniref:cyclin-dependent kinase inhibitor 7-like n=1 Tax=Cornus florida TaxID=4283 RepID=UPI00289A242B|nr:cyclin-dependent kinase inhibitor 7-like [Cornus florida]
MGKYMQKCKGIGEIAVSEVAQVGVRTRARALTARSGTAKRRKVGGGQLNKLSPSLVQLRNRGQVALTRDNSVSPATSGNSRRRTTVANSRCSSPSSDHVPASCCSSNGSSSLAEESLKFLDPEKESIEVETSTYNYDRRERRETTPSSGLREESGDLDSTARPFEANSRRRLSAEKIMPSETELEEFFAIAEKDIQKEQKRFIEKYNYDIAQDVPLEGRYNWVPVKP